MDTAKATRHLRRRCTRLAPVIARYPAPVYTRSRNSFETLSRAIVGQQLSGKAAQTIYGRYRGLFDSGRAPTPAQVLERSAEELRSAGLSRSKASFLHALASAYVEGKVNPRRFSSMSSEELHEQLTQVKGLGPWTVDMYLIFGLNRMDVLPVGDLGVKKGIQRCFELEELPTASLMEELTQHWRPYRSVACHYLWRLADES